MSPFSPVFSLVIFCFFLAHFFFFFFCWCCCFFFFFIGVLPLYSHFSHVKISSSFFFFFIAVFPVFFSCLGPPSCLVFASNSSFYELSTKANAGWGRLDYICVRDFRCFYLKKKKEKKRGSGCYCCFFPPCRLRVSIVLYFYLLLSVFFFCSPPS